MEDSKKKKIIIAILFVIIGLLVVYLKTDEVGNYDFKRTIIMYIDGSTLESEAKIATMDIASIDSSKIDLNKTNVLLYTGGTSKWFNFVDNNKNQLYKLTNDGFKLLEESGRKNMGDPNTLLYLLDYAYNNYKSKNYDLVIYDHGLAIAGAVQDDFTGDYVELSEFSEALRKSHFNSKNKFEAVIFRTCLNGTLEVANIFKDYSDYLVASEEISYGITSSSVLNFINDVELNDTGKEVGIKFVDEYKNQMNHIYSRYKDSNLVATYSVIDLSKIDKLNNALEEYVSSIDLKKNFSNISYARNNLYQYAADADLSYDMVDLYSMIEATSSYASVNSKKVINAINDAVKYNYSSNDNNYSHGISIYFPQKGSTEIKNMLLSKYKSFGFLKKYYNFLCNYNSYRSNPRVYDYGISSFGYNLDNENDIITFDLTEEQAKNYSNAFVNIYKKIDGGYQAILHSLDVKLDNLTLSFDYKNKFIKYNDMYVLGFSENNNLIYIIGLANENEATNTTEFLTGSVHTYYAFRNDNNKLVFDSMILDTSKNESDSKFKTTNGTVIDKDNYKMMGWFNYIQKELFNSDESVISPSDNKMEAMTGYVTNISDLDSGFNFVDLDDNGEYYAYFGIEDIYGTKYYSKILKIN